jgi:hypothetical protein
LGDNDLLLKREERSGSIVTCWLNRVLPVCGNELPRP